MAGADHCRHLGLDQGLLERLGRGPDPIINIRKLQCLEQFEQGRLIQGHRVAFLFGNLGGNTQNIRAMAPQLPEGTPSRLRTLHEFHHVQGRHQ